MTEAENRLVTVTFTNGGEYKPANGEGYDLEANKRYIIVADPETSTYKVEEVDGD